MTQRAVELSITPRLLMLENKLTGPGVRLEGLTDKLDFAQEYIALQLQEVKDDLHRARIAMDATKGWMEKKDDEEQKASRKKSNRREERSQRRCTEDSASSGNDGDTSDASDSSDEEEEDRKHNGLKPLKATDPRFANLVYYRR